MGFHGDLYLLELIDILINKYSIKNFIETGTRFAGTLKYVAEEYPELQCYSCEPQKHGYNISKRDTKLLKNVFLEQEKSQTFLKKLPKKLYKENNLFWLDAHGQGFEWPLRFEIDFITKHFKNCFILIDDFKVPDNNNFRCDSYQDQICSFEYIKDYINCSYQLYYPNYSKRTLTYHPLVGWGLFDINMNFIITKDINQIIKQS